MDWSSIRNKQSLVLPQYSVLLRLQRNGEAIVSVDGSGWPSQKRGSYDTQLWGRATTSSSCLGMTPLSTVCALRSTGCPREWADSRTCGGRRSRRNPGASYGRDSRNRNGEGKFAPFFGGREARRARRGFALRYELSPRIKRGDFISLGCRQEPMTWSLSTTQCATGSLVHSSGLR